MSEFLNCHFFAGVVPCGLCVVVVVVEKWNSYVIFIFIFPYSFTRKLAQKSKKIKNGKENVI